MTSHRLVIDSVLASICLIGAVVPLAHADPSQPSDAESSQSAITADRNSDSPQTPRLLPDEYYRTLQEARKRLDAREYEEAAELYRVLTEHYPDDGATWLERARLATRFKRHVEAIKCYQKVIELGAGHPARSAYYLACAYAEAGNKEEAWRWLETALGRRLDDLFLVRANAQLKSLRDDERFQKALYLLSDEPQDRDAKWRFDLAVLADEARRMHRNLYHTTTPEAFEAAIESLEQQIPELTDEQILIGMQRIIASISDGHSHVRLSNNQLAVRTIPLQFYLFSDGLYVIDAIEEYKEWIGSRVMKFGDTDTADAIEAVQPIVSRDNPMGVKAAAPFFLRMPEVLHSFGLAEDGEQARLVLQDRFGDEHTIYVKPAESEFNWRLVPSKVDGASEAPLYLKNNNDEFWFEYLPEDKTLYVQINAVGDKRDESLAEFAIRLRKFIDSSETKALVLDLRHNGGGNTYLTIELLRTLIHFETTHPGAPLYVLIGRATFSAAMNFTTDIDRLTNAVFVGEPTGSRPNSYGESTAVLLPYSKVRVSISSLRWQHSYPNDTRIWIAPEIPVALSSTDYFANRDPALDAVLRLIRSGG